MNSEKSSDSDQELDEDESDGSNTEALFEYLDVTFKSAIDRKIEEAENFFDQHDYALAAQSVAVIPTSDILLENDIEHMHLAGNNNDEVPLTLSTEPVKAVTTQSVETQTDESSFPPIAIANELDVAKVPAPDVAREEVSQLRIARESLMNKRKELADKIKQGDGHDANDEKKLYEYEEAIEAIDSAIDYKNEIICGRECVLSNNSAPGKNETNLISRLTKLTLLDLQRLYCKYFSKVVELRYSTKHLEKGIEELENASEQMSRRLGRDQILIKEMQTEYASRIKLIIGLYSKDPNSAMENHVRGLEKSLTSARQRQYDLERSLTELLVRHGYLLNGADYDVKQVVKMLGIDTVQMGLNWRDDGKQKLGVIPPKVRSALESATAEGQGMSRRMREAFAQRRFMDSQMPLPYSGGHHMQHPSTSRHHHHHHQYHHYNPMHSQHREPEPPEIVSNPVPEVRREKRKLIIQPSQPT